MMGILTNYNPKALYVAVKPLEDTVADSAYGTKDNCLVFDPMFDRTHEDAKRILDDFFRNARVKLLPIVTEGGAGRNCKDNRERI